MTPQIEVSCCQELSVPYLDRLNLPVENYGKWRGGREGGGGRGGGWGGDW